jgi:hypothetical protein
MNKRLWWLISGVVVFGMVIIIALLLAPKNPIPGPIRKQLTTTLLVPNGSAVVDRLSATYNSKEKLLIYSVAFAGTKLVVSEQPTPESFVDVPQVYLKVLEGLNNYQSFDVNVGTVHLTQPKELQGKQAAILNTKGTLMFVKPAKNLTDDQWRQYFNHILVAN